MEVEMCGSRGFLQLGVTYALRPRPTTASHQRPRLKISASYSRLEHLLTEHSHNTQHRHINM